MVKILCITDGANNILQKPHVVIIFIYIHILFNGSYSINTTYLESHKYLKSHKYLNSLNHSLELVKKISTWVSDLRIYSSKTIAISGIQKKNKVSCRVCFNQKENTNFFYFKGKVFLMA